MIKEFTEISIYLSMNEHQTNDKMSQFILNSDILIEGLK